MDTWEYSQENLLLCTQIQGERHRWRHSQANVPAICQRSEWEAGESMCTFRGEDHLQTPEDTEEHSNASEAEDPNGEEKKCYLWSALPWLPAHIHWRNKKDHEEENNGTQVCGEDRGSQERDSSARTEVPTFYWLGIEGAKVQATATAYWNRRSMEAIHIRKKGKSMSRDCGLHPVTSVESSHWSHLFFTLIHFYTFSFMSPSHTYPNTFTLIHFYTCSLMSPSLTHLKPASHCTPQLYNWRRPTQPKYLVLLNLCYVLRSKVRSSCSCM